MYGSSPSGRRGRLAVAATAMTAAVAASVAGCGSGQGSGGTTTTAAVKPAAGAFATLRGGPTHDQIALPVDAYALTVPERDRLDHSRSVLAGRCMRSFGYRYDAAADKAVAVRTARNHLGDFGLYENKRRYGVTDVAVAARYGYHLVSAASGTAVPQDEADDHGLGKESPAEQEVRFGTDPKGKPALRTASGQPIPPNGCLSAGDATFTVQGATGDDTEAVRALASTSFEQSQQDPAVVAARTAWSKCLAAKGYTFTDPLGNPGFDAGAPTVSPAESAMAAADAACKQQTHLTDVWLAAEAGFQQKWIAAHPADFRAAKSVHDEMMKRVDQVLGAAG
ncbi:hypothetical protein NMG29_27305 [Streptomyces cocklensis]|uniref:Lipoprotein n=1 Tax=Actinacidiphila cocklensis TaxID=887465 RepID=A0A9W4DR62_9ACTN|nr:hypothetical protein [Actinacidiphila cocklensis]MDD1061882.1 hypothetical protein [Actinacidiphila cocklensis]WSX76117.1 hypothetical protein OH826_21065 [Streptomyces sp. NBC_00899]CAG6396147.1 conserved exported hypothetical protein [Actinacidiphila cocklensis]